MTAPIRAGAAHLRRHHRGPPLCEWASGAGIPAQVPTRQPEYGGELWASFRASRCMRAGLTRPTWSASFPARASSSTPRIPSLRSQAATSAASLAVGDDACAFARLVEALPKGVVFRSRRIACAARFLSRTRVARFHDGGKELAPYTRVADFAERFFVPRCPVL